MKISKEHIEVLLVASDFGEPASILRNSRLLLLRSSLRVTY